MTHLTPAKKYQIAKHFIIYKLKLIPNIALVGHIPLKMVLGINSDY